MTLAGNTTLAGKSALVTGSTSGIGLAYARALAKEGANVLLNGFGERDEIEATRAGIEREFGVKAGYSAADMTKPDEIAAMLGEAEAAMGAVDILVNNAGSSTSRRSRIFRSTSGIRSSRSICQPCSTPYARPCPA
jgi:NAD(P)-dependent dehydrogenase (short-subunit alcohol dehydrogenase family)